MLGGDGACRILAAVAQPFEQRRAARHAAEVAGARRILHPVERGDHLVDPAQCLGLAGRGMQVAQRRQLVPRDVPVEPPPLPVAVARGGGGEPRFLEERGEQSVVIERQGVGQVGAEGVEKRAVVQSDGAEREEPHVDNLTM